MRINVEIPEDLHRRAKAKAALEGKTLKDFVIAAIEAAAPSQPEEKERRGR